MPSVVQIRATCGRHHAAKVFVDSIPALQLNNARATLRIPASDLVIALIDTTLFGSAKDGLAVCATGVYWKNIFLNPEYVTWDEFRVLSFQASKSALGGKISFRDGRTFDLSGNEIVDLVDELLRELQQLANEDVFPPAIDSEWMAAIIQEQFGPYDTESLKKLIASGQLNPAVTLVWREGMTGWMPYNDVSELNAREVRPTMPPPLPPSSAASPTVDAAEPFLADTASVTPRTMGSTTDASGPMVDLNNSPLDDLLFLPWLTLASGKRLMHERKARLGFQTIEEVGELLDLVPHKVQRLRERALLTPYSGSGPVTSARRRVVDY